MNDFKTFSTKVNYQFNRMAEQGILLHSEASKKDVWKTYINSFPDGTDSI